MKSKRFIVKIGGSCASNLPDIINQLNECVELEAADIILIVPGGWIFAEMVRETNLNMDAAHWMAVASMDIYGYYISSHGVDVLDAVDFGKSDFTGVCVILPYRLMKIHDELPHSWDVTSDSISLWLAHRMGMDEVIKVTDVDGVFIDGILMEKISADDIMNETTCIDRFAPILMKKYGIGMFVCNGLKGRVKDYILRGQAVGTLIKASRFD